MTTTPEGAATLIVLSRDQASFYEFLKPRQEAGGRTLVVLDRRQGDRRQGEQDGVVNRRHDTRRDTTPEAALALMSVLGFMILHLDADADSG